MSPLATHILLLIGGFGALYFGAEWLVRGSARIATDLGVSPVVVGLTLVSLGTSTPELVFCIIATLGGQGDLLVGNVLGSNLANIGLILGATALISPLAVADRVITREVPIMIVVTVFVFPLWNDSQISRGEGVVLILVLAVYVAFTFMTGDKEIQEIVGEVEELADAPEKRSSLLHNAGLALAGALGLAVGGWAIFSGAIYLVEALGMSESLVGLTVVAVGTSLPELGTSIVAAIRRQADIAVGNVVGSNIFNLTAVLGGTALVRGFEVEEHIHSQELMMVLIVSILLWPVVTTAKEVRRGEGLLLLLVYIGLMIWMSIAP